MCVLHAASSLNRKLFMAAIKLDFSLFFRIQSQWDAMPSYWDSDQAIPVHPQFTPSAAVSVSVFQVIVLEKTIMKSVS